MAHESSSLAQNAREGVNEFYYGAKAIDELPILVPIVIERFHVLLKKKKDGIGRVTILELGSERIVL